MAERRMISKVISISEKVNSLSLFGRLLYTWMIPHADDFGRLPGSPAKVRALVVPMADETVKDVEQALADMHERGLIIWYEVDGEKFIQITNFESHQQGLHKRTPSKYPSPPNSCHEFSDQIANSSSLSASETDIEELVCRALEANAFIQGDRIVRVDRQVRVQNSYIDIVATGERERYIFEIKRQRISNASLDQIIKYRQLLDVSAKCVLIGYGLSANFEAQRASDEMINVVVYDDQLRTKQITLNDVNCREITLNTELEGNKNRTENETATAAAHAREQEQPEQESFPAAYRRVYRRDLTPFQAEQLGTYIDQDGFEEAVINRAIERAALAGGGIKLILHILNDYAAAGAKTLEGAIAFDAEHEARRQRGDPRTTRQSRTFDILNQLEKEFEAYDTG
jgi:DNA replication protein DnaD